MIRKVPSSSYFKEWYEKRANACAVENNRLYRKAISSILLFHVAHTINKDNREAFKKIFGKPDTHWKGSEFYFHVWIQEFEGEKFLLMTAKGKGTCIEICDTSFETIDQKNDVIIRFVENLYFRLTNSIIHLV